MLWSHQPPDETTVLFLNYIIPKLGIVTSVGICMEMYVYSIQLILLGNKTLIQWKKEWKCRNFSVYFQTFVPSSCRMRMRGAHNPPTSDWVGATLFGFLGFSLAASMMASIARQKLQLKQDEKKELF